MSNKLLQIIAESEGIKDAGILQFWMRVQKLNYEGIMAKAKILGNMMYGDRDDAHQMLLMTQLKVWAVDGKVNVYHWGRDCDQYESDGVYQIEASLAVFEKHENDMYDSAEGPCSMCIISPKDASGFKRSFRDHAAEQMNY